MQRQPSASVKSALTLGQPFNPFKLFTGIFIPEALVRARAISQGAKVAYGRLARYAGSRGHCYPAVPTLAGELGVSVRQTQKYLAELERFELVRRVPRISESGQRSNSYVFLWHPLFENGVTNHSPEGVNDRSPEGVTDHSPKESQANESHSEEGQNIDLDYPPTNRKKRDSRLDSGDETCPRKRYAKLREALAGYMTTTDGPERIYPSDRQVVDVMDAAPGATEEDVVQCLRYLREQRGLKPGSRHGPRHFSWFKTVVADYFQQKDFRRTVFEMPDVDPRAGLDKAEFDRMTDALELEGG